MLYVSPLKALAVDVERNLRAPIAGIAQPRRGARRRLSRAGGGGPHRRHARRRARALPARAGRHPDHDAGVAVSPAHLERARGAARRSTRVIIDEIHALVPTKRGAHMALSLERLQRSLTVAAAAHRAVGDAASARRSRAVPRRIPAPQAGVRAGVRPGSDQGQSRAGRCRTQKTAIHDEFSAGPRVARLIAPSRSWTRRRRSSSS